MTNPGITRLPIALRCRVLLGLTAAVLTALTTQPARAQNIVNDPGFEQAVRGPYTTGQSLGDGWSVTQGKSAVYNNSDYVFDGDQSLAVADGFANDTLPSLGGVSQVLSTVAGHTYTFSFFADADKSNTLSVLFDGQSVFSGQVPVKGFNLGDGGQNPSADNFTFYSFAVTSISAQPSVFFQGQSTAGGSVVLDDVSVSPVPEASSVVSLSLGVACLFWLLLSAHWRTRGTERR